MQQKTLSYAGNHYINADIKRLSKRWGNIETGVKDFFERLRGEIAEPVQHIHTVWGAFLCQRINNGEKVLFCKKRITLNKKEGSSNGARLVYVVVVKDLLFLPLLLYSAKEEKTFYSVGSKKFSLQKSGLIQIVNEKLRVL